MTISKKKSLHSVLMILYILRLIIFEYLHFSTNVYNCTLKLEPVHLKHIHFNETTFYINHETLKKHQTLAKYT